jgi:ElaB/YqjD/DUF883 family membrane-anchored ribosome-binding protein
MKAHMNWKQVEGTWEQAMTVVRLANQIDALRTDIEGLASMVGPIANKQRVEDEIRQHPLLAVLIVAGVGFLLSIAMRRTA